MTIIKRADLGRPLTWDELDDNFQQVDDLTAAAAASVSSASASATAAATSASASATSASASANSAINASSFAADASASATVAINALMNSTFEPSDFDFASGGTLNSTDRNKAVYNPADNNWYSWVGTLPHVVAAGTNPLSDALWIPRTDQLLRQDLGSNELPGLSLIALATSGRLSDAIVSVYVNAFGGDKTGQEDSTAAVLAAAAAIRAVTDSRYVPGSKTFGRVIFGNGQYIVGDVPFFSGIAYEGQGRWQTLITPKAGSSFAFTTTGTTSVPPVVSSNRCLYPMLCGMTIGYGYQEQLYTPVPDAGGVNWSDVSYGIMRDVFFHDLHGYGLKLGFVWDSDFENVRIDNCGHVSLDSEGNITEVREGLNIGPGGSTNDGSNALRFRGLHIEDCPKLLHIGDRSRHLFFTSPKLEGTNNIAASSTIRGTVGVTFDCPELTWQSSAIPMFDIYGLTQDTDNYGLVFDAPTLISSLSTPGWYFRYSSYLSPLLLNNPVLRGVARLAEGDNIQIKGGSAHQSGPCLVKGTDRVIIEGVNWQNILASVAGDGSDDVIILTGYGNRVNGNTFKPQGSATDGSACINLASTANNSEAIGNNFYGSKNYGLRVGNAALYKTIYDNRIFSFSTSDFGQLISGIAQRFTVTSALNDGPLGVTGSLLSGSITVSNGVVGQISCFRGSTSVNLRAILAGSRLSVGRCFGDSGLNGSMTLSDVSSSHGNIMKTGTGTPGDGFIYVNQDFSRLTITNYSGLDITLYWVALTPYNA